MLHPLGSCIKLQLVHSISRRNADMYCKHQITVHREQLVYEVQKYQKGTGCGEDLKMPLIRLCNVFKKSQAYVCQSTFSRRLVKQLKWHSLFQNVLINTT